MEKQREYHQYEGIIKRVEVNSKNGPKGFFFFDEDGKEVKYTCWSDSIMKSYKPGDEVIVSYTIQENDYNGRVYHNKVIGNMNFKNKGDVQLTASNYELLEEIGYKGQKVPLLQILKSENGVIKMGGLFYRIKDIELELIQNKGEDEI